jgi:hypothetical protein
MIRGAFSRLAALERRADDETLRREVERLAERYGLNAGETEEMLTNARLIASGRLTVEMQAERCGMTVEEFRAVEREIREEMGEALGTPYERR